VAFSGSYDRVVLEGCADVSLDGVRAGKLVLRSSNATAVGSTFAQGIVAEGSQLVMTGGAVAGDLPLDLDGSRFDLAGVSIDATKQPYRTAGASRILFSVCPVKTPAGLEHLHGVFGVAPPKSASPGK
jgi:hypothetical protein